MSGIYNIGLFVVVFRTGSSGQVLVIFYTHNDNSTCPFLLYIVTGFTQTCALHQGARIWSI